MTDEANRTAAGCPVQNLAGGVSLTDSEVLAHPVEYYRALREKPGIHFDEGLQMYLVARYEDIQTVLRDPVTFSIDLGYNAQYAKGYMEEFRAILEREGGGYFRDAIMSDPPEHTRVRRLMERGFTAHRVKQLETAITDLAVELLQPLLARGECDAVRDFAVPMTSAIICAQLGVGRMPSETIQRWSYAYVQQLGRMQDREQMLANARDVCELQNFLIAQVKDRQQNPREDMISDLVHARSEEDGEPQLSFEETVSLVRATLVGGNDTTATALGNLFYFLATHPELSRELRDSLDDERLMNRFVEELIRFDPPVTGLSRMTREAVELAGTQLPAGAHLLLLWGAANDDESHFPQPREFDMERPNIGRHLGFGAGVHRCVGASLARMEVKVATRVILRHMDDIRLAVPEGQLQYIPTVATHTLASLPVTFSSRQ